MLPMIAAIDDVTETLALLEQSREELQGAGRPFDPELSVGAMIEVPAAAVVADRLAGHVAFFSLGVNDLIQYVVAADRDNARIARYYDPMHLGVLRLVRSVIDTGHANDIPVSTCGEVAEQFGFAVLLLGMGLNEFSMTPQMIPRIKWLFRSIRYDEARQVADEAFTLDTAYAIRKHVETFLHDSIAPSRVADVDAGG